VNPRQEVPFQHLRCHHAGSQRESSPKAVVQMGVARPALSTALRLGLAVTIVSLV